MTDEEFDRAMIAGSFAAIAREGWHGWSLAGVASEHGLDAARARARFATPASVLRGLGILADQAALGEPATESGAVTERLFDLMMRRIDVLQTHRAGVLALLSALPTDPGAALLLASESLNSMRWLLEAAGLPAHGMAGALRAQGLLGVWLWTMRAWRTDDSADLSATMAALDTTLARASTMAGWLPGGKREGE